MKIRTVNITILLAFLALLFVHLNAWAEEEDKPEVSVDVGAFSKYIWRGYELSDESVVIQPSVTVGYKGFSINMWGNLDTDLDDMDPDTPDKSEWNETDLTLAYDRSFGPVGLGVGYIYYGLDSIDDSQEVYLCIGLDIPLSPSLTAYREISHLPGWYFNFGISHSFGLFKGVTLDFSGSVGYYCSDDEAVVEIDDNLNPTTEKYRNLHDGLVSIGLTIPIGKYCTFSPMVAYSFPLSDDADNLLTSTSFSNNSDFFFGGATLSVADLKP
jgi:hypothetical protein